MLSIKELLDKAEFYPIREYKSMDGKDVVYILFGSQWKSPLVLENMKESATTLGEYLGYRFREEEIEVVQTEFEL